MAEPTLPNGSTTADDGHRWTRRHVLGAAGAAAAAPWVAAPGAAALGTRADIAAVTTNPEATRDDASAALVAQWQAAPGSHPLIPNVSQAGYRLGSEPPRPNVVARVTDFGAVPDGRDCVEAFNEAVRSVGESGGGVVLVPPGTYTLSGPVWMHWSNVVLRGVSSAEAILHFTRPLAESYMSPNVANATTWSQQGGQIFVISAEKRAHMEDVDWHTPVTWLLGNVLADVRAATRGQRTLVVSDTNRLNPGDMIVLEVQHPSDNSLYEHLAGDIASAREYDFARLGPSRSGSLSSVQWPVRVEAVLGEQLVRLAQPLKYDLRAAWQAQFREIGPTVHETGVEGLTIRNELIPQTRHNQHPGSNGLSFQTAYDCWARDVRVENCDVGYALTCAKSITMSGVTVAGRATHHSFIIKIQSHDNVVEDFSIEKFTVPVASNASTHGISFVNLSSGNVYRRGNMQEGTFDSHRGMPFENVRTDITLKNTGTVSGAAPPLGPRYGARSVHWNVRNTEGKEYGVTIADVAPRSASVGIQGLDATGSRLPADFPVTIPTIDWPSVFVDTFDDDPTGSPPSAYETEGPEGAVTVQPEDGRGNVLTLLRTQEEDTSAKAIREFAQVNGNALFSFNVKRGEDQLGFLADLMDPAGNIRLRVQFTRREELRYWIGDTNGELSVVRSDFSYDPDRWHKIDVVIDGTQGRYDLFVDRVLIAGRQPLADGDAPSAVLMRLTYNPRPPNVGSFSLDEIAVHEGDTSDGSPLSTGLESIVADFGVEPSVVDLYAEQRTIVGG